MGSFRGKIIVPILLLSVLAAAGSCRSTYYAAWEKLGKEKRHLLRGNIEEAKEEQEAAQESFKDVLTRMKEIYGFEGGELEDFYNRLKGDYETSARRAAAVEERIQAVERIAADLFAEWEAEIDEITNARLKSASRASLTDARGRYAKLERAMKQARARMDPVLDQLNDYVLFLKHNLNARAVGALQEEVGDIQVEVERLIGDIRKSIVEAESFLRNFE